MNSRTFYMIGIGVAAGFLTLMLFGRSWKKKEKFEGLDEDDNFADEYAAANLEGDDEEEAADGGLIESFRGGGRGGGGRGGGGRGRSPGRGGGGRGRSPGRGGRGRSPGRRGRWWGGRRGGRWWGRPYTFWQTPGYWNAPYSVIGSIYNVCVCDDWYFDDLASGLHRGQALRNLEACRSIYSC